MIPSVPYVSAGHHEKRGGNERPKRQLCRFLFTDEIARVGKWAGTEVMLLNLYRRPPKRLSF